jgi:hypothetical protein
MLAAAGAIVGLTWCALIRPSGPPAQEEAEKTPAKPFSFDLVPRGYDDNGLARNPQWGLRCFRELEDPASCSWRFLEGGGHPLAQRPLCNYLPVDPDVSTFEATTWTITCSDSPINYTGHINWGEYYGGASTFEGALIWDEYSGGLPSGDYDYNFLLQLPEGETLGTETGLVGVEFDSREVEQFASEWWNDFRVQVHVFPNEVKDFVGKAEPAIVTGLLGLDAEHSSSRELRVELHPAYAMALRVPCRPPGTCTANTWEIALFARAYGNEGLCSHWKRPHVLRLPEGIYKFRLPWKCGAKKVEVDTGTRFCANKPGANVAIAYNEKQRERGVLVTIQIPPGGTVDGQMYLEWTDGIAGDQCQDRQVFFTESEEIPEPPDAGVEGRQKQESVKLRKRQHAHDPKEAAALKQKVQAACIIQVPIKKTNTLEERPAKIDGCKKWYVKPMSEERLMAVARMDGGVVVPSDIPTSTPEQKYCSENQSNSARTAQFCSTVAP